MPAIRKKFSCGHKAFGLECPICRDLKRGVLIEVADPKDPTKKKIVCPTRAEREAKNRKVKVEGKEIDVQDLQDAITKKKR